MAWQFNSREVVFIQIADRLRCEIVGGKYPPGAQIPSVRQLATMAAVNPNTMQKALTVLEDEGLLTVRGTVGRFVTENLDVLETASDKMRRVAVKSWIAEAEMIGLSADEMIKYIKEESSK